MRISDWSSDVCSSDLGIPELKQVYTAVGSVLDVGDPSKSGVGEPRKATLILDWGKPEDRERDQKTLKRGTRARRAELHGEMGRAAGRERAWQQVENSVVAAS